MVADTPSLSFTLRDADETARLGNWLAAHLHAGDCVLLEGPIGAGKSHFCRAFIQSRLGRAEDVPSPTFTLVQTYQADIEIWHADLYRLGHPDEVLELGLEAAFDTGICLIEWPDRLGRHAPAQALRLRLQQDGESRRVTIDLGGREDLRAALAKDFPDA